METKKHPTSKKTPFFSLSLRINIITVCGILVATIGLVALLYRSNSDVVLEYKNNQYTFTQPTWSVYNNLSSTWQILVHLRYAF
jgi:hypothetical protein